MLLFNLLAGMEMFGMKKRFFFAAL